MWWRRRWVEAMRVGRTDTGRMEAAAVAAMMAKGVKRERRAARVKAVAKRKKGAAATAARAAMMARMVKSGRGAARVKAVAKPKRGPAAAATVVLEEATILRVLAQLPWGR
jgi:hypothetical protein